MKQVIVDMVVSSDFLFAGQRPAKKTARKKKGNQPLLFIYFSSSGFLKCLSIPPSVKWRDETREKENNRAKTTTTRAILYGIVGRQKKKSEAL